jgi:hypothetical protein
VVAALIAMTTAKSRKNVSSVIVRDRNLAFLSASEPRAPGQLDFAGRNRSKQMLPGLIAHRDDENELKHPQKHDHGPSR